MKKLSEHVKRLVKIQRLSGHRRRIATFMAAVVVFVTTYNLILPAITIEYDVAQEMPGIVVDEGELINDSTYADTGDFLFDAEENAADQAGDIIVEDPQGNVDALFADDGWVFDNDSSTDDSDLFWDNQNEDEQQSDVPLEQIDDTSQ